MRIGRLAAFVIGLALVNAALTFGPMGRPAAQA